MTIYKTYEEFGLAKAVFNISIDITQTDTPMYSMSKTEKVHARQFSYQTDTLASAA